jgi:penicillin-binding protein 1A
MSTSPSLTETIKSKINNLLKLERPWLRKTIKYVWIAFFCFIIGFPLYIYTVSINLFGLYGEMPSLVEVENPENDLSSEIIGADGVSLGRYYPRL